MAAKASSLRAKFEQMAAGGGEDKVRKEEERAYLVYTHYLISKWVKFDRVL